jgi:hypothetical protein
VSREAGLSTSPPACSVRYPSAPGSNGLQQPGEWPWRESPQVPGVCYVRLRATSPTYGAVTIVIVHEPVCRAVRRA